jgi:hypothetical protein
VGIGESDDSGDGYGRFRQKGYFDEDKKKKKLQGRFGKGSYDDPMESLVKLKHVG